MKTQQKIQAQKRTLLMLTGTLAVALGAFASTAAASNAHAVAGARRAMPPIEIDGTYGQAHPGRRVLPGASIPSALARVNTAGVASKLGVLVQVDATGHVVSPKGTRLGGMPLDS